MICEMLRSPAGLFDVIMEEKNERQQDDSDYEKIQQRGGVSGSSNLC